MKRELTAITCWKCSGSGEVDHRDGFPSQGFVTMEARGVRMVPCPVCGGVGEIPVFKVVSL